MDPGSWVCGICTFLNSSSSNAECEICGSPRPDEAEAGQNSWWACSNCTLVNQNCNERCFACNTLSPTLKAEQAAQAAAAASAERFNTKEQRHLERIDAPNKRFSLFISSTFTDTHKERDILLRILARLQLEGRKYGIVVIFFDMRFGVKDTNTLDQLTWIACRNEIERCYRESRGVSFFLSLQGDKYGYRPLPKYIKQTLFESRRETWTDETVKRLASEWYRLDENAIPSVYVLQHLSNISDSTYWEVVLPTLRAALTDIPIDGSTDLVVGQSVTDWETRLAISMNDDFSRCFWVIRKFDQPLQRQDDPRFHFFDTNEPAVLERLNTLRATMTENIPPEDVATIECPSLDAYLSPSLNEAYLHEWSTVTTRILSEELGKVIENVKLWDSTESNGFEGIHGHDMIEILHHVQFCSYKCQNFFCREDLIKSIVDKVVSPATIEHQHPLNCICLAVIGKSGLGKTGIMAKTANLLADIYSDIPVIIRFCGTSSGSFDGLELMRSICLQTLYMYNETIDYSAFPEKYENFVPFFHKILSKYPVILIIDSLDQLSNNYEARSRLTFLLALEQHPRGKVIVSTLPDDESYSYLCDSKLKEAKVSRVVVPSLDCDDANSESRQILESLLAIHGRRLTEAQMAFCLETARAEPTSLYLYLTVSVVKSWTSDRSLETSVLTPTVKGLINQIFDSIARDYGKWLVHFVIGFITFSVDGINDVEIQDLLSMSPKVIDEVFQYTDKSANMAKVPFHVWSRLYAALSDFLVEKSFNCWTWHHRQLKECAESRYSEEERIEIHKIMGFYFGNISRKQDPFLMVAEQPLVLNEFTLWSADNAKVNIRRCLESAHQLVSARMYDDAEAEICNLDYVCAVAKCGSSFLKTLINQLSILKAVLPDSKRIDHYLYWVRRDVHIICAEPSTTIVASAFSQPLESLVRIDVDNLTRSMSAKVLCAEDFMSGWIKCKQLGGLEKFDEQVSVLTAPGLFGIDSVSFHPNGNLLASGSRDKDVRLWDMFTGTVIHTLCGHSDRVWSVCFSSDGKYIVTGSKDKTIKVWDSSNGNLLNTLCDIHSDDIYSVCLTPDESRLISASRDKTIAVINFSTLSLSQRLIGHENAVYSVTMSRNGEKIASCSFDKTIRLWDLASGLCLCTYIGHNRPIRSLCFSPDASRIVSGGEDEKVIIWSTQTGEILHSIESPERGNIYSVAWSPDSSLIACGTSRVVRLIDPSTGNLIKYLRGHSEGVSGLTFSPDSKSVVSSSHDDSIRVWDANIALTLAGVKLLHGHSSAVSCCAISHNRKFLASGGFDKITLIWDLETENIVSEFAPLQEGVNCLSWSVDDKYVFGGCKDKSIVVWDASSGEIKCTQSFHGDVVSSVDFSKDGRYCLSSAFDHVVAVWKFVDGIISQDSTHECPSLVMCAKFNPVNNGEILAACKDCSILLWNHLESSPFLQFMGHNDIVYSLNWSPDGKFFVSGSRDTTMRVWNKNTQECLQTISVHGGFVVDSLWIPSSSGDAMVVSGSEDGAIRVWKAFGNGSDGPLRVLRGHTDSLQSLAMEFTPDGNDVNGIISTSSDRTIRRWSLI